MTHRHAFEAVDRTFRDILDNDTPFGGKVVVFSGDFRQILPVVKKGSPADTVNACFKTSDLWAFVEQLHLTENMRVRTAPNPVAAEQLEEFASFLLEVGEGRRLTFPNIGEDFIRLPTEMVLRGERVRIRSIEGESKSEEDEEIIEEGDSAMSMVIQATYGDITTRGVSDGYFAERAILTITNIDVQKINNEVADMIPGESRDYLSTNQIHNAEDVEAGLFEQEYLDSLQLSGIAPHKIVLKVGAPIMLIRNINRQLGLCNGTRLRVEELDDHVIHAVILTGLRMGQHALIPRIYFVTSENHSDLSFQIRRKQFPVVSAFAMTINKAQGQSLHHLGLYLPSPVFTHDQLYVALSRITAKDNIKIAIEDPDTDDEGNVYTKNIVFRQIFE